MLEMLRRIYRLAGRYRGRITAAFFTALIKGIAMNMPYFLICYVFMKVYDGTADASLIKITAIGMILSILVQIIFQYASDRLQSAAGFMLFADTRLRLGAHLRKMPMGFFTEGNIGRISSVLSSDMSFVEEVSMTQIANMANYFFSQLIMTGFLFYVDVRLGITSVIVVAAMAAAGSLTRYSLHRHSRKRQDQIQDLTSVAIDYTEGIGIIKTYNLLGERSKELTKNFYDMMDANIDFEKANFPASVSNGSIYALGVFATLFTALRLFISGELAAPMFITLTLFIFQIYGSIRVFYDEATRLTVMNACLDRIESLFEGDELPDTGASPVSKESGAPAIEFRNVTFSYGENEVIHDMSFQADQHTVTALVGPSGSGKSTVASLLTRFWDVDSGSVLLYGTDIREMPLETVYDQLSIVFQKVYLFRDTIYNNITIGRPDATREEVMEAARKAMCYDFIMALPQGFETVIGEGGASLSGGEKQRISIARCILKDAPIVILDEATASVDLDNEREIQQAISSLVKDKTLIMIAHRLNTIRNADNIIVIEDGRIAESGTHDRLMDHNGTYKRFTELRSSFGGWSR